MKNADQNPWNSIPLQDYEAHMSLDGVYQLQTLNEMMRAQFESCPAQSVMILGVAGGNGLQHLCGSDKTPIFGVDSNPEYLAACVQRYPALAGCFVPLCIDLAGDEAKNLPHADLLVANLLVEYIGTDCFAQIVRTVAPGRVSCVIQLNTDSGFVSQSPYLHVFDGLSRVHHQLSEEGMQTALQQVGYRQVFRRAIPVPGGKTLLRLDYDAVGSFGLLDK